MATNLEIVRAIHTDWERGDFSSAAWADPEIAYVPLHGDWPEAGHYRGPEAMARFWGNFLSIWSNIRIAPEELAELDDGVLVHARVWGRSKRAGIQTDEFDAVSRFTIRDSKVVRLDLYVDLDEALSDAGLTRADLEPWAWA